MNTPHSCMRRSLALPAAVLLGVAGGASAFVVPGPMGVRHTAAPASLRERVMGASRVHAFATSYSSSIRLGMSLTAEEDAEAGAASAVETPDEAAVADTVPPIASESEADEGEKVLTNPLVNINEGDSLAGTVDNVVEYGAFVDVGAEINGLVHISQMSNEFVSDPNTVVALGDAVSVKVMAVDKENKKLVLSMRTNERAAPREQGDVGAYLKTFEEEPDKVYNVAVNNVVQYGVFVTMDENVTGFVHNTQLRTADGGRVQNVEDSVKVGDMLNVRVRSVDETLRRINLTTLEEGSENNKPKDLGPLLELDRDVPHKGTITSVVDYGCFMELAGVEGLLHISKVKNGGRVSSEELMEMYSPGDEVEVYIHEINEEKNNAGFSTYKATERRPAPDFSDALELSPNDWITGKVVSTTEYGAFVHIGNNVDGMVHISEMVMDGVQPNSIDEAVQIGDELRVRAVQVDAANGRVRLSMREEGEREAQSGTRSNDVSSFDNFDPEEMIEGTVQRITNFGAFVNIAPNCDALLHISQISDEHTDRVEDVLEVGQKVNVRVINVDADTNRVGVSMKDFRAGGEGGGGGGQQRRGGGGGKKDVSAFVDFDPTKFIPGTVVSTTAFGAFVSVAEGVDGLVHISQIANERVEYVEDFVQVGDSVEVRVLRADPETGNVSLSMVEGREDEGQDSYQPREESREPQNEVSFGDDDMYSFGDSAAGYADDPVESSEEGGADKPKKERKPRAASPFPEQSDEQAARSGAAGGAGGAGLNYFTDHYDEPDWQKYLDDFNRDLDEKEGAFKYKFEEAPKTSQKKR